MIHFDEFGLIWNLFFVGFNICAIQLGSPLGTALAVLHGSCTVFWAFIVWRRLVSSGETP